MALSKLNQVDALAHDYVNFFQPVRKLQDKTRDGAKVTKRYDRAHTPYQRLLATRSLPAATASDLANRYVGLNPIRLKLDIDAAQQKLYTLAVQNHQTFRLSRVGFEKILK